MKGNISNTTESQNIGSVGQNISDLVPDSDTIRIPVESIGDGESATGYLDILRPFRGIGMAYSVSDDGRFVSSLIHAETAKGWGMVLWEDLLGRHPLQLKERFHQMKDEGVLPEGASFRLINFNPFLVSDRVNPIQCRYIRSMDDALQVAASFLGIAYNTFQIEGDLNRYRTECENLLAAAIYFLVNYDLLPYGDNGELLRPEATSVSESDRSGDSATVYVNAQGELVPVHHWMGRYSSLPHVFSLLMSPDKLLLDILCSNLETARMVSKLQQALCYAQFSVLDRVIGSLRSVISRFMDPKFYWVLSGDDFDLNVSSAEHPVFLSMSVGAAYRSSENAISCFILDSILSETRRKREGDRPCGVILADYPSNMAGRLKHWLSRAKHDRVSLAVGLRSSLDLSQSIGLWNFNFLFRQFGTLVSSPATTFDTVTSLADCCVLNPFSDESEKADCMEVLKRSLQGADNSVGVMFDKEDTVRKPFLTCLKPVWESPSTGDGEVWRHTALDIFREDSEVANERYLQNFKRIESDVEELRHKFFSFPEKEDYVFNPVMGEIDGKLYEECLNKL